MIVNTDTFFISTMTQHCLGIGTHEANEAITSPQGIMETILNFFTFGAVRRERCQRYAEFEDCFTHALAERMTNNVKKGSGETVFSPMPEKIEFDYQGYALIFHIPAVTDEAYGEVRVSVFKPEPEQTLVRYFHLPQETFTRVATLSLLRHHYPEKNLPHYLDEDGNVDFGDIVPAELDLRNLDTQGFFFRRGDANGNVVEDDCRQRAVMKNMPYDIV